MGSGKRAAMLLYNADVDEASASPSLTDAYNTLDTTIVQSIYLLAPSRTWNGHRRSQIWILARGLICHLHVIELDPCEELNLVDQAQFGHCV